MSITRLTVIGMFNYDNSLFDNLKLPEEIDRNTLINTILVQAGEFESLYSDFDFLKWYLGIWSSKWYYTFNKWVKASLLEYNPIENYDRIDEWTDETARDLSANSKDSRNSKSTTVNTGGDVNVNQISPYDNDGFYNDSKVTMNINNRSDFTDGNSGTSSSSEKGNVNSVHKGRMHGNIGVTTSQRMLEYEYEIALFNVIQQITDIFIKELCIGVF